MVTEKIKTYGLDDIELVPAVVSDIEHREECNVYNEDEMLPIFTAPMSSVINADNYRIFNQNKINTIIPRNIEYKERLKHINNTFIAMSLSEFSTFIDTLSQSFSEEQVYYVCIDLANGHMKVLLETCKKAKQLFGGNLVIMTGNIANPKTYLEYAKCGIDFVRVGIGGGSACITSVQTGVHYGHATLIEECAKYKKHVIDNWKYNEYQSIPYIVADGGLNYYSRIIKALALGADYIMIGKIFAECEEACGDMFDEYKKNDSWTEEDKKYLRWDEYSGTYYIKLREYYGMSTKRAQKETGRKTLHTSEGISKWVYVNKTLPQWCENFVDYLRSAMSYANARTLDEFRNCERCFITEAARKSYYK